MEIDNYSFEISYEYHYFRISCSISTLPDLKKEIDSYIQKSNPNFTMADFNISFKLNDNVILIQSTDMLRELIMFKLTQCNTNSLRLNLVHKIPALSLNNHEDYLPLSSNSNMNSQDKEIEKSSEFELIPNQKLNRKDEFFEEISMFNQDEKKYFIENLEKFKKIAIDRQKKHQELLKEIKSFGIEKSNKNEHKINNIKIQPSEIFYSNCLNCLKYPIHKVKFCCLLCDNITLCEDCSKNHLHPLLKISNNKINNQEQYLELYTKLNEKTSFFKKFKGIFNDDKFAKVKIEFPNIKKELIEGKPDSLIKFAVKISNVGNFIIPGNSNVICLNNKGIEIENFTIVNCIPPKGIVKGDISMKLPDKNQNYHLKFVLSHPQIELICESANLIMNVGIDRETLLNEIFVKNDYIMNLKLEEKEKLFYIISNEISKKPLFEIINILKLCEWDLNEAIVGLTEK